MKLLAVLLAFAVVGFASDTITGHPSGVGYALPETDDTIETYAYNDGEVFSSIPASFTDYATIDDLNESADGTATIDSYTCWAVTTAAVPTELELMVVADASGAPDGAPVSQTSYTATVSDSGFAFGSYTVYIAVMAVGGVAIGDTPIWLGSHRNDGNNWYPACGTTVTGTEAYRTVAAGWAWQPISSSLESGDLFKVIEGSFSSLSRTTWAGIKNNF